VSIKLKFGNQNSQTLFADGVLQRTKVKRTKTPL